MDIGPICEICGKSGWHEPCSPMNAAAEQCARELDDAMLVKYAKHGAFGVCTEASRIAFLSAKRLLETYLGRALESNEERVVEGRAWWFLPEGWIGMLGFIVEVDSHAIYPLGSGLHARYGKNGKAPWGAIEAYQNGDIEACTRLLIP